MFGLTQVNQFIISVICNNRSFWNGARFACSVGGGDGNARTLAWMSICHLVVIVMKMSSRF